MGRHTGRARRGGGSRSRVIAVGSAVFLLLVATTVVVIARPDDLPGGSRGAEGSAAGGGSPPDPSVDVAAGECTSLAVVAATSYVPVLEAVAGPLGEGPGCVVLDVTAADGRAALTTVADRAPHVWIPDDTAWVAGADPDLVGEAGADAPVLATSPIHLRMGPVAAEQWQERATWSGLAEAAQDDVPVPLVVEDPAGSGDGLVAVGAVGESVWLQSGMDAASGVLSAVESVARVVEHPATEPLGEAEVALVAEHDLLLAGRPSDGTRLMAPGDHAAVLRYTFVATTAGAGDPAVEQATARLGTALGGPDAQSAREAARLRPPDMTPPPGTPWLPGTAAQPLDVLGGHHVEHVFAAFYEADRQADVLMVVDISGSMFAVPPDSDRPLISEVKDGVLAVADRLPDDSRLGVWEFGASLDPPRDHRVVSAPTDLGPQARMDLASRVSAMNAIETGTGLHDTVLAAYVAARDAWRPEVRSQVLVFSDGINEADDGSLTVDQLRDRLAAEADPERPVNLAVVVYGPSELTEGLAPALEPVGGYVTSVRTAADVTNAFSHVAAGGLHG